MRRLEREIRALAPKGSAITRRSRHLQIELPNGRKVVVAGTPGDHRFLLNVKRDVRREMQKSNPKAQESNNAET